MFERIKFKLIQQRAKYWYWVLFFLTLLIGLLYIFYVAKSQDAEMRDNLIVYAKTIEQSIDWRPYADTLNINPDSLKEADLAELVSQLNSACKANKNCHFIYLLYTDTQKGTTQVKFLLDASPQPASEISHLGEIFVEASEALKQGLTMRSALVEGPVTDHWGTWVSAHVPLNVTVKTPNFVMLGVDVAASNWNRQVYRKIIAPSVITVFFLLVLAALIYQSRQREKLYEDMLNSASALTAMANNDSLTGLPNRRLLEDRMAQVFKFAQRSEARVAVFFLDLDYFKQVNDTHGHKAGDQLLRLVATRLSNLLRADDSIARIGGDEFIILLPNIDNENQTVVAAQKIINALAKPFSLLGLSTPSQIVQIGVSVGIAIYPDHGEAPNDVISHADMAMYAAKRKGRNCYAIYDSDWQ